MALKKLVVERGKIAEEMIESVVSDFIGYELNPNTIVFKPKGASLRNDAKILVYLVAVLGWQYVADDEHTTDTRPAALEATLGIPGGTLRPILKKMKDAHLLTVANKHYSIRPSNLDAIGRIVQDGQSVPTTSKPVKTPEAKSNDGKGTRQLDGKTNKAKKKPGVPILSSLDELITDGFFVEYRTLGEVADRLHELAIIARATSLSGPIADCVRDKKLQRKKIERKGKQVWAYKVA